MGREKGMVSQQISLPDKLLRILPLVCLLGLGRQPQDEFGTHWVPWTYSGSDLV